MKLPRLTALPFLLDRPRNPTPWPQNKPVQLPPDAIDLYDYYTSTIDEFPGHATTINLPKGNFLVPRTIPLHSNLTLRGTGHFETALYLAPHSPGHMFTNSDFSNGNSNITVENLVLHGNSSHQSKRRSKSNLLFSNFFLFRRLSHGRFRKLRAFDCRQTVLHFNHCSDIEIDDLECEEIGWSGISTSGTDGLRATNTKIILSGLDKRHSAIHLDGGIGTYLDCVIESCTGNGVMLDSKFSPMTHSIVKATCHECYRGISLSGAHNNELQDILIRRSQTSNNSIGIMVSNSKHVFIDDCVISNSKECGILLQGKYGGQRVTVSNTVFKDNNKDLLEKHQSDQNFFVSNNVRNQAKMQGRFKLFEPKDSYTGNCSICGRKSTFSHNEGAVSESYKCQWCKALLRHRAQAQVILDVYGNGKASIEDLCQDQDFRKMKVYEPGLVGPFRKYFRDMPNYIESYYWEDVELDARREGLVNQDLHQLTFDSDSLDLVITSEIFEHVRRPFVAFGEICRVLVPGGRHIFTIPVRYPLPKKTKFRVDTSGDEDVYLVQPNYHIAGDGGKSLVYTDFGEDLLDRLAEIGLSTTYAIMEKGHPTRGSIITFVSTKIS